MIPELLAPAKLTLSLRVLGVREDGFHALEALTVSIDAPCDSLTVEPGAAGIRLAVDGPAAAGVPADGDNLVARAALAVLPDGVGMAIGLRKEIPPGSGLGGGSSDAAAVLRAGADAFGLDPTAVREAAAALGSDIPFCLQQEPAWMRGRGEVLDPVALAEPLAVLVVVPPFSISTPAVYRAWDEMGGPHSDRGIPAPAAVAGLVEVLANDLEPAAERVEPELVAFREALESAAGTRALLAGSGSACWIPFRDATVAREAAAHVAAKLDLPAHVGTTIDAVTLP